MRSITGMLCIDDVDGRLTCVVVGDGDGVIMLGAGDGMSEGLVVAGASVVGS